MASALAATIAGDATAGNPIEVQISSTARKPVRLLVSEGTTKPCDSSDDRKMFEGWIQPGQKLTWSIPTTCVCVHHTYDDFPRTNWSVPGLACSPRTRRGFPASDPTIRVTIPSTSR